MMENSPFGAITAAKGFQASAAFTEVADTLRTGLVELVVAGRGEGEVGGAGFVLVVAGMVAPLFAKLNRADTGELANGGHRLLREKLCP